MRNYGDFDDPQKMELLGMIKTSSESAYNLLENLLQWARTQTERIKYSPADIDLGELINKTYRLVREVPKTSIFHSSHRLIPPLKLLPIKT
jgi:K+-sensing histidine kinase KdpD